MHKAIQNPMHGLCTFVTLVALLGLSTSDASARGRGGGRSRPHIDRSGPANQGSFSRAPSTYRRPPRAPDPGPDRFHERGPDPAPDPGPDRFHEQGPDPAPGPGPGDVAPDRVRDQRIDDRDDRRDYARRHRAWRRGTQLSYLEWGDYDCGDDVVVVDDDELFECDGTWFIQTYYGGEVVYTATDPPRGY